MPHTHEGPGDFLMKQPGTLSEEETLYLLTLTRGSYWDEIVANLGEAVALDRFRAHARCLIPCYVDKLRRPDNYKIGGSVDVIVRFMFEACDKTNLALTDFISLFELASLRYRTLALRACYRASEETIVEALFAGVLPEEIWLDPKIAERLVRIYPDDGRSYLKNMQQKDAEELTRRLRGEG